MNLSIRRASRVTVGAVLTVALATPAAAATLLSNGNFNTVGPFGPVVLNVVPGGNGASAAKDWLSLGNSDGFILSELMPSNLVAGGTMVHVVTEGERNGLQQVFGAFDTGPRQAFACIWLRLVSGSVGIGVGNGGGTNGNDVVLNKPGTWEVLQVSNAGSPANQLVIAALTPTAEFFVESARVDTGRVACKAK